MIKIVSKVCRVNTAPLLHAQGDYRVSLNCKELHGVGVFVYPSTLLDPSRYILVLHY